MRIKGFDGLRALAVVSVFLDHKVAFFNKIEFGNNGVTLFFVLSGYLITRILLAHRANVEKNLTTPFEEIIAFFKNRCFRIFPAYYAMIIISTALTKMHVDLVSYKDLPYYITFTTNFYIMTTQTWQPLAHFWSLAVEEQFYLISAPLFLLTPIRHARVVVAGFVAAAVIAFCAETATKASNITIAVDPLINFGTLGLGCGLALAVRQMGGSTSRYIILSAGLLILAKTAPFIFDVSGTAAHFLLLVSGVFAAIIIWATAINQNCTIVSVLNWAPLRGLGRISYAFYIWHLVVDFSFAGSAIETIIPSPTVALAMRHLAEFLATVAIAAMSWRFLEAPALRLRDAVMVRPVQLRGRQTVSASI